MRKRMLLDRLQARSSAFELIKHHTIHPSSQNRSKIGVWIKEENNKALPIQKHHPIELLVSEDIVLPSTTQTISKHSTLIASSSTRLANVL
jgi:hypothetical protein